jgi:hypothetical protein
MPERERVHRAAGFTSKGMLAAVTSTRVKASATKAESGRLQGFRSHSYRIRYAIEKNFWRDVDLPRCRSTT